MQTENDILWIFPREIGASYLTNKKQIINR